MLVARYRGEIRALELLNDMALVGALVSFKGFHGYSSLIKLGGNNHG